MNDNLLPCPFCGARPAEAQWGVTMITYSFRCDNCGCEMEGDLKRDLTERWNTRAALTEAITLLWQARRDILQTARVNQMRLTGRDIVTGDTTIARPEVNQRGIDESLALTKSIEELTRKLQPVVKQSLTTDVENL